MPAILTHYLFGIEVYDELELVIGAGPEAREAFLLGNQGPDPLLCLKALPRAAAFRDIGTVMHVSRPAALLASLHEHLVESAEAQVDRALPAFALGFLCHYLLDSTVHPLVYAQQNAICGEVVQGLPAERAGRIVHALIETALDEHALRAKLGAEVGELEPHAVALPSGERELRAISGAFGPAVHDTYRIAMPPSAFAASVRMYRAAQAAVDSRRNRPALPKDLAQAAGGAYLHFRAFVHSVAPGKAVPFTNEDHVPWTHPFVPGAVVSASFDELYAQAFAEALDVLPAFAQKEFSAPDCGALAGSIDFYGKPIGGTA
ncbi:MAG: hypothetical protein E7Z99_06265 [Coriobacteriaceae bacterium]|nr:hypothetical protein [Coriobacteriaceae bacterium]